MLRIRCFPLAVAALSAAALVLPPTAARAQTDYETTRIADGVYQFRWVGHNGFFVVTPAGVVAVDPISPEAATQYAREIRSVAPDAPLVAIIYSHHDADHATGAPALMREMGQEVPVLAHRNAVAPLAAAGSADLPVPTDTYREFMSIAPGGRLIELHYVGANHTDNSTVVFVPDAAVAFAVDFVSNDRAGFQDLQGAIFPRLLPVDRGPSRDPLRYHRLRPRAGRRPGVHPPPDPLLRRDPVRREEGLGGRVVGGTRGG